MARSPVPIRPERIEQVRAVPGQRTQCLRGLPRRLDLAVTGAVQGRRRREDNEVHHEIREQHPGIDVKRGIGSSCVVAPRRWARVWRPRAFSSSTSWEACQKKR